MVTEKPIDVHSFFLANTKHLYNICTMLDQRRRRWADVVQMVYRCLCLLGTTKDMGSYPTVCQNWCFYPCKIIFGYNNLLGILLWKTLSAIYYYVRWIGKKPSCAYLKPTFRRVEEFFSFFYDTHHMAHSNNSSITARPVIQGVFLCR